MKNNLEEKIRERIELIQDFPKPGISFKDFTPLLKDAELSRKILDQMEENARSLRPNLIVGLESRGFMFGFALAQRLGVGFIPVRKPGKLPREVYSTSYELEYGATSLELHREDVNMDSRIIIHDDLLATGGTARAAFDLLSKAGVTVLGFDFTIELDYLKGRQKLPPDIPVHRVVNYH